MCERRFRRCAVIWHIFDFDRGAPESLCDFYHFLDRCDVHLRKKCVRLCLPGGPFDMIASFNTARTK